jgi:hypothetical protein
MAGRRFPPPWTIEDWERRLLHRARQERLRACLPLLRGGAGRRAAANLMTCDEARRIAKHRQAAGAVAEPG